MTFKSARCEICHGFAFAEAEVVAYKIVSVNHGGGPHNMERIDLKGEEPWAGIRCVHKACASWVGGCAAAASSGEPK